MGFFESNSDKVYTEKDMQVIRDESRRTIERMEHDHELEVEKLRADNVLALKEKEFEIKHVADERVKKAEDKLVETEKKLAVAESRVENLEKIVDLNADIIDVKDLVTKLINKLPEVNITGSLGLPSGNNNAKPKDQAKS